MKIVAFDLKGSVAHFRRPDTTATQMTYPFITPTAARGLVGAILGITDFVTSDRIGVQLLHPVRTVSQQMSMLGKDGGSVFNRPTTVELLVNPAYRIFYTGNEYTDQLIAALHEEHAVYPTYLGTAYALTKPVFHQVYEDVQFIGQTMEELSAACIVPTSVIEDLVVEPERHYSRAGGFMHRYIGQRVFERSIDFVYERDGKPIRFRPVSNQDAGDVSLVSVEGGALCLF